MAIKKIIQVDGTFNVVNKSLRDINTADLYHSLLSLNWKWFLTLAGLCFFFVNALFATAYYLCGPSAFIGIDQTNNFPFWIDCFFFSVQTFATIGYGRISPLGYVSNILVSLEAFTELMLLALATGLFFARFSKPTSRLIYSKKAIIGPIDGENFLYFRIANARFNQLVDARVSMNFLKEETTQEGKTYYTPYTLKLENSNIMILALTFTLCHPIDKESPFYGLGPEKIKNLPGDLLISITGTDSTIGQTVNSRYSYSMNDIIFNGQFVDILEFYDDGSAGIDLDMISDIQTQMVAEEGIEPPTLRI